VVGDISMHAQGLLSEKGQHTKDPVVSSKRRFDTVSCGHTVKLCLGGQEREQESMTRPTSPVHDILHARLKSCLGQPREADSEGLSPSLMWTPSGSHLWLAGR
jgi:hypothetical protein